MSRILSMSKSSSREQGQETRPAPLAIDIPSRLADINMDKLMYDRLARLRGVMAKADIAGAVLSDPMNIRYATGTRNMSVWTMHAPGRYAFVPTEGPIVLFEFASSKHVSRDSPSVAEQRDSTPWIYFLCGPRVGEKASIWAKEVVELVMKHGGGNRRLAVDRCEPQGAQYLISEGIELLDAQALLETSRVIKTSEELKCLRLSMDVCDVAVDRMREALTPGITENQLWSILHETNIAHDGEWIECRLLASGERTNPWFQECGNRIIEAGDLVGFDTDMVGPCGYLADISRSLVCPGRRPTDEQRKLYGLAQEQIMFNVEKLRPGVSFREFGEICWRVPEAYVPNRYMMMVHGVGMVDEYPSIAYAVDFRDWGYDGVFEENMVVSVESYIGAERGKEGVKLEQQVLITAEGPKLMSRAPFEDAFSIE